MASPLTLNRIDEIQHNPEEFYFFTSFISMNSIKEINSILQKCNFENPNKILFTDNITSQLSSREKGIYVFTLEDLFPYTPGFCYLLYIGRVQKTNNFKNRFYDYQKSIGNEFVAQNKMLLTNLWYGKTYVYFYKLNDDKIIEDIEKILVNRLKPPFNEDYFTEKAVNNTDLYKIAKDG